MLARLGAKINQLVGVSLDSSWSQVQVFIPGDWQELVDGGAMTAVMCLPATPNAASEGNDQLQALIEDFQQHNNQDRLEWLKSAIANFEAQTHQNERLLLVLIVPHEQRRALYVAGVGPMSASLERWGKRQQVWSDRQQGQIVSGWLNNGDIIIAGTAEFVDSIWQLTEGAMADRLETAQAAIVVNEQQALMAGVVLEINEPGEETQKVLPDLPPAARVLESEAAQTSTSPHRPALDIRQRLMGGKALAWLRGENSRPSRRASLIIGAIFLVFLVVSISVGVVRKEALRRENEFNTFIEPLQHSLLEAQNLKTVNPVRARSLVAEVRDQVGAAGDKFANDKFTERWQTFLVQIDAVWGEVSGENQAVGKLWMDLKTVRDYLIARDLVLIDEDTLGVVDRANGSVVSINMADKNAKVIGAGDAVKKTRSAGVWRDKLVLLSDQGVSVFGDPQPAETLLLEADAEIWPQISQVTGFTGNLYLAGDVDIWRYPGLDASIGQRQRWLKPGVEPDLSGAADWAFDGEIWVMTKSGQILRFNQGRAVGFEVKGLVQPLDAPVSLTISQRTKELIVLEPKLKSLIFISQETGDYKRQLIWDKLTEAGDIIVDEKNNRILVGIGQEVFELGL